MVPSPALAERILRDRSSRSGLFVITPAGAELLRELVSSLWVGDVVMIEVDLLAAADPPGALDAAVDGALAVHGVALEAWRLPTLAARLAALSDSVQRPLVLLLPDVLRLRATARGGEMLYALKAARDELNLSHAGLTIVATGADRAAMLRLVRDSREPFFCATLVDT